MSAIGFALFAFVLCSYTNMSATVKPHDSEILVDMVTVGEETGELETTMGTISGYYDTELEMAAAAAVKKLEPALLIFMAVVTGFIVIAVYVAMFEMYNVL